MKKNAVRANWYSFGVAGRVSSILYVFAFPMFCLQRKMKRYKTENMGMIRKSTRLWSCLSSSAVG